MREDIDQSGFSPEGTWYDLRGSGSSEVPVVMIHGVGLDHTMWEPQMPALEEAFCVLRYDMLGHGQSEARPVKDITTFVRQLEDCLLYTSPSPRD